ncbi:sensor histidine kinase [Actinoplanes couchii]|uniref:histidine kinase n=1 Tax=Actinoplanes couchii TaxID=403638 RepID=A0ABQ3XE45_9ACTN|nr:HAMP domain-containing sensor histidine kinase [Actinoplanes couchii]MDR6317253.1 signal transduction histidine kinase [Actinoplanes couchii]GID56746.1 hypothetical protein Aco03nite_051500 [Actinoplanes couchii]
MIDVIHRRAGDLHSLIVRLLDVAGARSGHIRLRRQRFDLAAVARSAVDSAVDRRPPVTVDLNTPAEVMIDGDAERVRDAVDELLRNALTWAPDDSVVGVTVHADPHTAVLAVSNTGARVPAEEHARIFDLFYRTPDTHQQGIPGHGLGLTLARAIVEQHGGAITVSEPDEAATTFTVRLPAR